jgi:hypothetical protein
MLTTMLASFTISFEDATLLGAFTFTAKAFQWTVLVVR